MKKLFATIETHPDGDYLYVEGKNKYTIRTKEQADAFLEALASGKEPMYDLGITCSSSIYHVGDETDDESLVEVVKYVFP